VPVLRCPGLPDICPSVDRGQLLTLTSEIWLHCGFPAAGRGRSPHWSPPGKVVRKHRVLVGAGRHFRVAVEHPPGKFLVGEPRIHHSPFGFFPSSAWSTSTGECRLFCCTRAPIIVRYRPSIWRRVQEGDLDQMRVIIEASVRTWRCTPNAPMVSCQEEMRGSIGRVLSLDTTWDQSRKIWPTITLDVGWTGGISGGPYLQRKWRKRISALHSGDSSLLGCGQKLGLCKSEISHSRVISDRLRLLQVAI
jgi:hypothetical protein